MSNDVNLSQIIFLDIETVPEKPKFADIDDEWQKLWQKKVDSLSKYYPEEVEQDNMYQRAGIYSEFGRIVCISLGVCYTQDGDTKLRIKSFSGDDECQLLTEFNAMLDEHFFKKYHYLCAHNGQEFDFPFICRRSILNGLPLPKGLQIMGNKPWENRHLIDTMRLWAFGDFKNFTSLELLAKSFGLPSPKDDISGADVYRVFYEENDLKRIVEYCQLDVQTLVNVYCSLMGKPPIPDEHVTFST